MTPEGKIKVQVRDLLRSFPDVHYFMPVQWGYGAAGLDFHCIARVSLFAVAFFVETKAPGGALTPRQETFIARMRELNAQVFVVDDEKSLSGLRGYLTKLQWFKEYADERAIQASDKLHLPH